MFLWLLLAFTAVPILEVWLLVRIGGWLGAGPTIVLVIITGTVGAALARHQGVVVIRDLQKALSEQRMPHLEILSGVLVFGGGLMLLTPGVLTDLVGLLLMVAPLRRLAARGLATFLRRRVDLRVSGFQGWQEGPGDPAGKRTIEVPFEHRDEGEQP